MACGDHLFLQRVAKDGLQPALQAMFRCADKEIGKVQKYAQMGAVKKTKAAIRNAKRSDAVRISCLHKAGLRSDHPGEYLRHARQIELSVPFEGDVPWVAAPKRNGGHRPIVNLPMPLKARHYMVARLVGTQFDVPQFIYGVKGKGRDRLISEIKALLEAGYVHVLHADIENCFNNINEEALYGLPLAKGDIENTLFTDNLRLLQRVATEQAPMVSDTGTALGTSIGTITGIASTSGPMGLMQGSPASNIILAHLLRGLRVNESEDVKFMLYSDNFILMSRSKEALSAEGHSLAEQLFQSSFGPLVLVNKDNSDGGYFEFLGYGFQKKPMSGIWEVFPSQCNWDKLDRLHEVAMEADLNSGSLFPFHGDASVRQFLTGFKSVTWPDEFVEIYRSLGLEDLLCNEQRMRGNLITYALLKGYKEDEARKFAEMCIDCAYDAAASS